MELDKVFLNLGLAKSMAELLTLVLVLLALSVAFWFVIGRFKLHNFLINTYVAFALASVFPADTLAIKNVSLIIFLASLVVLTLLNRYIFDIHQQGSGLAIWQVLVMSFLEMVLLVSIIFSYLPNKEILVYISKGSLVYFIDPWWRVIWMVLPLAFLVFVKKRSY